MVDGMNASQASGASTSALKRRRHVAWILILVADAGYVAWGAMAAALPDLLPGPGGTPILTAGYEGFAKGSWSALAGTSPMAAKYMVVLFRMYGLYCLLFGLMAIAITVTAFRRGERWAWWTLLVGNTIAYVSEYLGLAVIYGALAVTAPFPVALTPLGWISLASRRRGP
jgi:hypothetical protein